MESVNAVLPFEIPYRELPLPLEFLLYTFQALSLYYRCVSRRGEATEKVVVFCVVYLHVPTANRRTYRSICGY